MRNQENRQGTENLMNQLGRSTDENVFSVNSNVWSKLNQEERTSFNKAYGRLEGRRMEIINGLSEECRDTVSEHFTEIASSVSAYMLHDLKQIS